MAEQQQRQLNPLIALATLYKKDGKTFKDLLTDITANLNTLGVNLDAKYIEDKVLPWVASFVFMAISESMLREYIANLSNTETRKQPEGKMPTPPPAEIQ